MRRAQQRLLGRTRNAEKSRWCVRADTLVATKRAIFPSKLAVAYADSRRRPLARRARRTARPPLVDIRARKPCFFARRRILG